MSHLARQPHPAANGCVCALICPISLQTDLAASSTTLLRGKYGPEIPVPLSPRGGNRTSQTYLAYCVDILYNVQNRKTPLHSTIDLRLLPLLLSRVYVSHLVASIQEFYFLIFSLFRVYSLISKSILLYCPGNY